MQRRYKRYFIILEEEDRGFSIARSEGARGYSKIEVRDNKGVLSLYCQNMKVLDEEKEIYQLYLISTEDERNPIFLNIADLNAEEDGRLEYTYSFDNSNIENTNKSMDSFDTMALIVRSVKPSYRLISPLVGYIHKERTNWRPLLESELYPQTQFEQQKSFKIIEEYDYDFDNDFNKEYEDDVEFVEDVGTLETVEVVENIVIDEDIKTDEDEELEEDVESDVEDIEYIQVVEDEIVEPLEAVEVMAEVEMDEEIILDENLEVEEEHTQPSEDLDIELETETTVEVAFQEEIETKDNLEVKVEDHIKVKEEYKANEINQDDVNILQEYIEITLEKFLEIEFKDEKYENYKWWEIPYDSNTVYGSYMPFISHIETLHNPYYYHHPYYYNSQCQNQIYNYQHHIFGIAYDEDNMAKYYIYGLPGRKNREEQPYRGETGFVYWEPSYRPEDMEKGLGYWLLYIDANTNGIVEPFINTPIED